MINKKVVFKIATGFFTLIFCSGVVLSCFSLSESINDKTNPNNNPGIVENKKYSRYDLVEKINKEEFFRGLINYVDYFNLQKITLEDNYISKVVYKYLKDLITGLFSNNTSKEKVIVNTKTVYNRERKWIEIQVWWTVNFANDYDNFYQKKFYDQFKILIE